MQEVSFNARKAYVRKLARCDQYHLLQPVIGLCLVNDIFGGKSDAFLHHYKMVNVEDTGREIDGLQLVFVELPKFHPKGTHEARELWLRFLNETGEKDAAPEDLRGTSSELDRALTLAEEAAYSVAQLEWYDRCWDAVSTQRTLVFGKFSEGYAQGFAQGHAKAMAERLKRLVNRGMPDKESRKLLGL